MKHQLVLCTSVALVAGLTACSSSSSGGSTPTGTGALRIVNGISDTTTSIDASVEGISTQLNADFGTGSGFADIVLGTYKVTMAAQGASGGAVSIVADNVSMDHDVQDTVYAVGLLADSNATSFVVTRPTASFGTNQTEVQFVNATSGINLIPGILNVYLVAPGSGLAGISTPAGSFVPEALRSDLDTSTPDQSTPVSGSPVIITSGSYEVIVTGPDSSVALYDSGPGAGIAFNSGTTLQLAIVDVTPAELTQYTAALQLVVLDNSAGSTTAYFNGAQ